MELFISLFFLATWALIWRIGYVLQKQIETHTKKVEKPTINGLEAVNLPNIYDVIKKIDFESEVKKLDTKFQISRNIGDSQRAEILNQATFSLIQKFYDKVFDEIDF